jgi:two-component system, OmpR family, phosphate regulon sensor histidine kinase PhoR
MRHTWQRQIHRLLLLVLLSALFGWLIGSTAEVLCITLGAYSVWSLYQLIRLFRWLIKTPEDEDVEPPESTGLYGDIFDGIYNLQRRNREARMRLESVINRIQTSAQALNDGIIMIDARGHLEWWNKAAERLLGFDSTIDVGQEITNLIRSPDFKRYFDSQLYAEHFNFVSPVNPQLQLHCQITLLNDKNRLMMVRDVSRIRRLEQMRKDFFANVSHELRTPLTVIKGYLETLLDSDDLKPAMQRALEQMSQQSMRMDALINDLLLLNRLETSAHTKSTDTICVDSILKQIRHDALALSNDKQHSIELISDVNLMLIGSTSELHSAFSNLIFNAVKYTPAHKKIIIRSYCDEQGAHVSIIDEGVGIEPQHIPRLTERFYRADSSHNSQTGGTGLGLAIVKHVLMRHDAELDIQSVYGKGSTFTCHFPRTRIAPAV